MSWFRKKATGEVKEINDEERIFALRDDPDNFEELDGPVESTASAPAPAVTTTTEISPPKPIDLPSTPSGGTPGMSQGEALLRGMAEGYTMGGARFIGGKEPYEEAKRAYPKSELAGEIISGFIPSPLDLIPGGALARRARTVKGAAEAVKAIEAARNARLAAAALRSGGAAAARGALEGGARGALTTEGGAQERAIGALQGAGIGAVGGGALGAAVPAVAAGAKRILAAPAAVSKVFSGLGGDSDAAAAMNRMLATGPEGEAARALAREGQIGGVGSREIAAAEKDIRNEIGPSPTEAYKIETATRQKNLGSYTNKIVEQQRQQINRAFQKDVSEIVKLKDEIITEAHTGLKGDIALRDFKNMYESLSKSQLRPALERQRTVYRKSRELLDTVEGEAKRVLGDDTYEKQAHREAKDLLRKITAHREKMIEAQGEDTPLLDPQGMADNYIIIDNVKRDIGDAVKSLTSDRSAKESFDNLYHDILPFLEDHYLFGNMGKRQREINREWNRDLLVSPAIESAFMISPKKRALPGADKFEKRSEVEGRSIEGFLSDPSGSKYDSDRRNLLNWLDSTLDLSDVLVHNYKDTSALQAKVKRIEDLRERVLDTIGTAKKHASSAKTIVAPGEESAVQVLARRGGNPASRGALERLLAEERRSKIYDPERLRRMHESEQLFERDVTSKLGDVNPVYPAVKDVDIMKRSEGAGGSSDIFKTAARLLIPRPTDAARRMEATESAINRMAGYGESAIAPKVGTRATFDEAMKMWGDRAMDSDDYTETSPAQRDAIRIRSAVPELQNKKPKTTVY